MCNVFLDQENTINKLIKLEHYRIHCMHRTIPICNEMYVRKIERRIAQIPYRWDSIRDSQCRRSSSNENKTKNNGICSGVMGFIAMLCFVWAVAVGGENRNIYDFHGDLKMPLRLGFNCFTTIWQHSLRLEHSLLPFISLDSWHTDENMTNNRN